MDLDRYQKSERRKLPSLILTASLPVKIGGWRRRTILFLLKAWPIFRVRTVSFLGRVTHLFRTLLNKFDSLY